jgi:hypothetical protein
MAVMLLALGLPHAARAQTDPNLTSKLLISILVKKGVLSQADANSIMQEAQAEASAAQTEAAAHPAAPPAPTSTVTVTSTRTPDGTIHVTYIPPVVQNQIASAVTTQITAQQRAQGYSGSSLVPEWVNRLHFYGDFRMRYEDDLFPQGNDNTDGFPNFNAINTGPPYDIKSSNFPPQLNVDQNRNRFRVRGRLGVDADLGDGFDLGLRIATGDNNSPVSENVTLGGAPNGSQGGDFSKYAIWMDRAYLSYTPPLNDDLKVKLIAGRFDNPFFSTNLIWADDLGFDGAAATASYKAGSGFTPFLTGGAFPIYNTDFNYASNQPAKFPSNNKWLFGVQGGTDWKITDDYAVKFGVADYLFTNVAGKLSAPCFVYSAADQCNTDADRPSFAQNGNTYMALRNIVPTAQNGYGTSLQYQYFGLASGFDELAFTGEFNFSNFDPTHIWVDGEYVRNLAFNSTDIANKAVNNRGSSPPGTLGPFAGGDNGYFVYANVGQKQLQKRGDWNAMLGYKYIQTDAVVDGFNDPDFGLGGTNLQGYIVGGNVAVSKQVWVRLRYLSADSIAGPTYRADVLQLDLNAKF